MQTDLIAKAINISYTKVVKHSKVKVSQNSHKAVEQLVDKFDANIAWWEPDQHDEKHIQFYSDMAYNRKCWWPSQKKKATCVFGVTESTVCFNWSTRKDIILFDILISQTRTSRTGIEQ